MGIFIVTFWEKHVIKLAEVNYLKDRNRSQMVESVQVMIFTDKNDVRKTCTSTRLQTTSCSRNLAVCSVTSVCVIATVLMQCHHARQLLSQLHAITYSFG